MSSGLIRVIPNRWRKQICFISPEKGFCIVHKEEVIIGREGLGAGGTGSPFIKSVFKC